MKKSIIFIRLYFFTQDVSWGIFICWGVTERFLLRLETRSAYFYFFLVHQVEASWFLVELASWHHLWWSINNCCICSKLTCGVLFPTLKVVSIGKLFFVDLMSYFWIDSNKREQISNFQPKSLSVPIITSQHWKPLQLHQRHSVDIKLTTEELLFFAYVSHHFNRMNFYIFIYVQKKFSS